MYGYCDTKDTETFGDTCVQHPNLVVLEGLIPFSLLKLGPELEGKVTGG